ncbi:MAG: NAD(P)/FAD-dependent oxidoreductase [Methanospirillum sp.]
MKVAIAGAGVAGGYLAALLTEDGLSPDVYDAMAHGTRCGCRSCGWGAPARIAPYLERIGLDPDAYILETMPSMNFDGLVARTPLLTIDKPRLLRDLTRGVAVQRRELGPEEAEGYDVIVDATGLARSFLPPCSPDLTLPTLQHRVVVEPVGDSRLEAGVYGNDVPGLGYLWVFPLGNGEYHVGVGGIGLASLESLMERFYREMAEQFSFTRVCGCRDAVRVASPYYSMPFYTEGRRGDGMSQRIVGVGESIGTVAPFTGEGIAFSLECARILAEHLSDPADYTRVVLSRFAWMKRERETLDYLLAYRERGPRMRDRWRFYRSARRSDIDLPLIEAFKQMGSLSHWVTRPGQ